MSKVPLSERLEHVAEWIGVAVFLLGLAVLVGWLFDDPFLKQVLPVWAAMAPSTATCFAVAGTTLDATVLARRHAHRGMPLLCRIGAIFIALVALLTLAERVVGWPLGLDHLLLKPQADAQHPAQMAVPTALGLLFLSAAFFLARSRFLKLFQLCVLGSGLIGWLGLSTYIFGHIPLLFFQPMAMHTALTFIVLGAGMLCLRPDGGVIGLFLRETTGGLLARRLVPATLFVPLLLAWLCLAGTAAGWFSASGAASLFTLTNVVIFGALIWKNAAVMDRSDLVRTKAEQELERQSSKLREQTGLLEEANVIGWNLTEGIFFWNKGAQELYGWTEAEALGKLSHQLLRTRFPKSFDEIRNEFFANGHWEGELIHRKRDGSEVAVASSWKLHRSERGGVASVVEVNNDITELKHAEDKLRAQLNRLHLLDEITRAVAERQDLQSIFQVVIRRLEDHLPVDFGCVCLKDPASNMLTVVSIGARSESFAMGLAIKEQARFAIDENGVARCLQGQLVYEPDTRTLQFSLAQRMAEAGLRSLVLSPLLIESRGFGILMVARRQEEAFSSGECEFLRQLSEHVGVASNQAQLYGALQRAYDDLRQTQQAVMQHERLRAFGEMASGIAHDVNNVLSPVMLYTALLLEQEPNLKPASRRQIETIQRAVEDISETIDRMKEFYRQREPQTNFTPVQVNLLIPQVIDLTRLRWNDMPQERGVVIETKMELDPALPDVLGIESEIREALVNLIFNAVDAMPKGGTLTLRTRVAGKNVCVEVIDTGTGMTEEVRRRCLEPFYTTKGDRGSGLGLAMVYGTAQRHSAELEIESAPGKGTTMRLIFPGVADGVKQVPAACGPALPPVRRRILLVDDDPLLLKSLQEFLEADGHVVVTCNGGQAGIDAFRAAHAPELFDLVITDLGMPYVDGRAVAQAVKTVSADTPVILLTGWGKRMSTEGEVPPHVDHILSKPPKLYELRAALAKYC